jgi:hypothetical protein
MGIPTRISCNGIGYDSILALADAYKVSESKVGRRLRSGWTPEQAVGITPKPKRRGHGTVTDYKGRVFPHLVALAKQYNIDPKTLRARLARGYDVDSAVTGILKPRKSANSQSVEYAGNNFPSKDSLARAYGLTSSVVGRRLKRGWTMEQALGSAPEPPRFRNHEGAARDTRWKTTRSTLAGIEPVPDAQGFKLYLITNQINGKEYVGITIGDLEKRLKQHFSAARRGRKNPLANAINKHGEEAFHITLLRNDAKSFDELQDQEILEIARRKSSGKGYNSALGGSIGTVKAITVNGQVFQSHSQAAEHFGIDPTVFSQRVTRLKWTPEEATGITPRHWEGKAKLVSVGGKTFSSIRDAASAHSKPFKQVYDRLSNNWTLEQALGVTDPPDTTKYQGKNLVIDSVIYPSIAKAAAAYNVDSEALRKRLVKGEDAVSAIAAISRRSRRS